jgi:hypothetical protein
MSFIKAVRMDPDPTDRPIPAQVNGTTWQATGYATAALNAELANIAAATDGSRNDTLNRAAFNMAQLIAGGQISAEQVQDALVSAARAIGLGEREIAGTIRSGFAKGQMRARTPTPAPFTAPLPTLNGAGPSTAVDNPGDGYGTVDWAAVWADQTDMEWILEPLLPAGRLVALYSPPKVGKSLLMLELAIAIAAGKDALGSPTRATKVLYLDFENDPQTDIKARLIAMGHGLEDVQRLAYMSYPACPPLDTPQGGAWLYGAAKHHGASLVVIDTISRCISGEENDNNTWLNLYKHTGLHLKRDGIAMLRLDHSGKDESKGQRGGSAKGGDVDAVWRMTEIVKGTTYRLECEMQRIHIQENALTLTRTENPLGHQVTTAHLSDLKREAILRILDDAGLPKDAGRDLCSRAVRAAGIRVRTDTLSTIIKTRRGGAEDWAPPVPETP